MGREALNLEDSEVLQAKKLIEKIAADIGAAQFYLQNNRELERSQRWFDQSPMVKDCLRIVADYGDCYGHGFSHIRKVALDAGAILLIEVKSASRMVNPKRLVLLGHLAGLLHDVKRREKNHAQQGAQEAAKILTDFALKAWECSAITRAIANHEAFQPQNSLDDPADQLLSDALYDADKFRWGPDNFTETLWAMLTSRKVPLSMVLPRFLSGLEGIRQIRETFRTPTGKAYGPDFIDRGLEIGRRFYAEMTQTVR
jgi:hypothetical protein